MKKIFFALSYIYDLIVRTYGLNIFKFTRDVFVFLRSYSSYLSQNKNTNFKIWIKSFYPCLNDRTTNTPLDYVYIYQDSWAAGKVLNIKPKHHHDIGSKVEMVWIISACIPTTMVDIRKVDIDLPWLNFVEGSILDLPFEDNSIESISSVCVVEHIGLWRYWDPINPFGSEEAIHEIKRVLKVGGHFIFSVPVDGESTIYFNAHRAFSREYIMSLMDGFILEEEKYIYGKDFIGQFTQERWVGIWCYYFIKK